MPVDRVPNVLRMTAVPCFWMLYRSGAHRIGAIFEVTGEDSDALKSRWLLDIRYSVSLR